LIIIKKEKVISYNELKEESIKYFNIDIKNEDNIEFIYTDEDQEKNILQHDDEDILSAANFIDNNYLLNLDLIIINNQKTNIKNKINENKNQVNNIKVNLNNEEKKREINNNMLDNKLKQIGILFKIQFYLMKNDITNMINNKYKEIENELKKLNVEINNNDNNEIIKERIEKSNEHYKQNQNQKENKSNKRKENKTKQDKNSKDYILIEKSTISQNNIIKENDDLKFNNDLVNNDKFNNKNENNLIKEDIMNVHGSNAFNSNNNKTNKINDAKFEKIMKNINSLYKNKNNSYNDIKAKGNKIFGIMNKEKIEVIEINKYVKYYLTKGQKNNLQLNEKIKYYNILKYLNKFLEIKNIQTDLDDILKDDIKLGLKMELIKEKYKQTEEENIKDENNLINFIDSLNKKNNKIYVQQKLNDLIKKL